MLAVKGLYVVCWIIPGVLQTLELSIAKIMGCGRVGRASKRLMPITAKSLLGVSLS